MSEPETLPQLLRASARKFPAVRALYDPHAKPAVEITYQELQTEVAALGAGMLMRGIVPGDHVALFSDNQPRWLLSDLAITGIGAVDVPRGSDTANSEFEFILNHSGARYAVIQDRKIYDRLSASSIFQALKLVILLDDSEKPAAENGPPIAAYSEVLKAGLVDSSSFYQAADLVKPETLASIVYTSGTTGSPKGVMLTQGNILTQPRYVRLGTSPEPGEIQLSILPSWHVYERATEYYGLFHGTTLTYSDKRFLRDDLIKIRPHLLPCVPRIWESVYQVIHKKLASAPEKKQKAFKFFTDLGFQYVYARRTALGLNASREPVSVMQKLKAQAKMVALYPAYKLGDKLVFSQVRQITGGRLKAAVSGGGSLAPYIDDFFEVVGIQILNGYGLTETSPVCAHRTIGNNVRGSVGHKMPHTEISIRNEAGQELGIGKIGEIWVKGPQVMMGYYNNEAATLKVLKDDGWFVTGDLGWLSATGNLVLSGRAKDTIVLSSGENVEPEPIEDACRKSPLVGQIIVVGQDQKTLGALVVPDFVALAGALGSSADLPHDQLIADPKASTEVKQSLSQVMAADGRFKAAESISKVYLLAESFSEDNGTLTSTMKIKRNVVLEKFKSEIEALYK